MVYCIAPRSQVFEQNSRSIGNNVAKSSEVSDPPVRHQDVEPQRIEFRKERGRVLTLVGYELQRSAPPGQNLSYRAGGGFEQRALWKGYCCPIKRRGRQQEVCGKLTESPMTRKNNRGQYVVG